MHEIRKLVQEKSLIKPRILVFEAFFCKTQHLLHRHLEN